MRCMSVKKKRMANLIKSIIPKAALCYQWHSKGVLMHCLRAQPPPLPQKSKLLWSFEGGAGNGGVGGGSDSELSETREGLF